MPESAQSLTRRPDGALERRGRVYLSPEPVNGPHPGFRGPLVMDAMGVHISWDCEVLYVGDDGSHEWEETLIEELIPWHRVHSVEWLDSEEPPDA